MADIISSSDTDILISHIQIGVYQHYKGGQYEVLGIGKHSENEELFVVYRPLYVHDEQIDFWIRPFRMFTEMVMVDGKEVPRFKRIDSNT